MKKILIILIIIGLILSYQNTSSKKEESRGVFISYIELQEYLKEYTPEEGKRNIDKMVHNISKFNLNTIILQVRVGADAIYDSKIYPYSSYISSSEGKKTFDVLEYFLKVTKKKKIKLIAWINPYRVRTTNDTTTITKKSPAYKYLNTDYLYQGDGIFFNPSKKEVENLIVEGVKEVLNYPIDGILFDDYFYPNSDIDILDYEEYIKSNPNISLEEYHLNVVNHMISRVHQECKKKKIPFGISPDGNIDNNYQKNYADVRLWLSSKKYIDFIMPQIYYGFYNSTKGYCNVIHEWENLLKEDSIDLLIALAFYKVGIEDKYAKEGRDEWIINDNIIMREVLLSRNLKNYHGFSLFRYDNIFNKDIYTNNSISEIENLKKILK